MVEASKNHDAVIVRYQRQIRKVIMSVAATAWQRIIIDHYRRYPLQDVTDLYKLVFQATFGSEHMVSDPSLAREQLEAELRSMGFGPIEPLTDPISATKGVVRIHLRPYIQAKRSLEKLLLAFCRTADEVVGTRADFWACWQQVEMLAATSVIPVNPVELRGFYNRMEDAQFPAVHHSQTYRTFYSPAYRVVIRDFLE